MRRPRWQSANTGSDPIKKKKKATKGGKHREVPGAQTRHVKRPRRSSTVKGERNIQARHHGQADRAAPGAQQHFNLVMSWHLKDISGKKEQEEGPLLDLFSGPLETIFEDKRVQAIGHLLKG